MTRAYKHTAPGGGGPMGSGAIPTSMQPRPGLVRVPTKAQRRRVEREYEPEPEIEDEVPADDIDERAGTAFAGAREQSGIQLDTFSDGTSHLPQGSCCFCGNTERDGVLVSAPMSSNPEHESGIMVCDQCTDKLIDAVRAELPRRRLRLAMERLAAGAVSLDVVEQIEKLAAGQYPVKTDG